MRKSRVFHGSPLKHAKLPIGAAWTVKQCTTCMDRTNIGRTSKEVSVLRKRYYDDGSQQTWCEFSWQKFQQSSLLTTSKQSKLQMQGLQ